MGGVRTLGYRRMKIMKKITTLFLLFFLYSCSTTNLSVDNFLECTDDTGVKITSASTFKYRKLVTFVIHTYDSNLSSTRWVAYNGIYKGGIVKGLDQNADFYVQSYDFIATTRAKDCFSVACSKARNSYLTDNSFYDFSLDRTYLQLKIEKRDSFLNKIETRNLSCKIIDSKRYYEVRDFVLESVEVKKTEYNQRIEKLKEKRQI